MNQVFYELKEEKDLDKKLEKLFSAWIKELSKALTSSEEDVRNRFVKDGFYPFYLKQSGKKILFIGREALGMEWAADVGYTKTLLEGYKSGIVGETSLNKYKFHALMFYITYLIKNYGLKYSEIDYATVLAKDYFAKEDGISFAFMNLSKFSNENKSWQLDKPLFDSFVDNSGNFIAEEIELLNPDLIITMNINDKFDKMGCIGDPVSTNDDVYLYEWKKDEKSKNVIPLADMWHFSAPRKASEDDYITPLFDILNSNKKFIKGLNKLVL